MSTKGPEINSEVGVHVDLETTGNGQKEPAFETFCVEGTKKENVLQFSFFCALWRCVGLKGSVGRKRALGKGASLDYTKV
jgi:hypothetical protein